MSAESMWPTDPVFSEVLAGIGLTGSPFVPLPDVLAAADVQAPEALLQALRRMLHGEMAVSAQRIVIIWALDQPYPHPKGTGDPSTVVYVEITTGTIKYRWPRSLIRNLVTDDGCSPNVAHPGDDLAALADHDFNWSFYSRVIPQYGPLRVWWATLEDLNACASTPRVGIREWKNAILLAFRDRYGRFPLRNRRA